MILMYHKVAQPVLSPWFVSPDCFRRQMEDIRRRGFRVVYLEDYNPADSRQLVITFDDVYSHLVQTAAPILREFGFPFELFILGGEQIDKGPEPSVPYATHDDLRALIAAGGRLQWHTMTHVNLQNALSDAELDHELTVPESFRQIDPQGFKWFAYPFGAFSPEAEEVVRRKFSGAVIIGSGLPSVDRHRLQRFAVHEATSLRYLGLPTSLKVFKALANLDFAYLFHARKK